VKQARSFSLTIYLLIVVVLSWPFQIAYAFLGEAFRPILLVSMVMVTVGTYVCGRYIFRDGFENAGWHWGKPKHYLLAFSLASFLWLVPSMVEQWLGVHKVPEEVSTISILATFLLNFVVVLIPAFGEEFGWRGYMLPRLLQRYSARKALLIHAFITWVWHLPFIVVMGMKMEGNPVVMVLAVILISLIPAIMHGIVFAYFWASSQSIVVVTVYHSAFDEIRDTLEERIGFGPLVEPWQMVVLTILGLLLLLKTKWINRSRETVQARWSQDQTPLMPSTTSYFKSAVKQIRMKATSTKAR
jgi:membrane protease YdiL (CAAX protease family)